MKLKIEDIPGGMKITGPIWSDEDNNKLSKYFNEFTDDVINHIYHDKELIALQKIIKLQKEELENYKQNSIPVQKIQDKIDNIEEIIKTGKSTNNLTIGENISLLKVYKKLLKE